MTSPEPAPVNIFDEPEAPPEPIIKTQTTTTKRGRPPADADLAGTALWWLDERDAAEQELSDYLSSSGSYETAGRVVREERTTDKFGDTSYHTVVDPAGNALLQRVKGAEKALGALTDRHGDLRQIIGTAGAFAKTDPAAQARKRFADLLDHAGAIKSISSFQEDRDLARQDFNATTAKAVASGLQSPYAPRKYPSPSGLEGTLRNLVAGLPQDTPLPMYANGTPPPTAERVADYEHVFMGFLPEYLWPKGS